MTLDDSVKRFWERTLEDDSIDHEEVLADGGEGIAEAVELHKLLGEVGAKWRKPQMPSMLGRFEVRGSLGEGGLSRVWLAWDPELRREVAIKVIERDGWAANEARSIARLEHISVVKVFEVGHDRLVMEVLDGGSLADAITALKEDTTERLASLHDRLICLIRIAEGLAYCHERGVLHRDVKPGNVMFPKGDERPRLIDFGLAHVPEEKSLDITQSLVGTPAYIAPEQVELGATGADPRSDQFSFGVLAYELLTLANPFAGDSRTATLNAVTAAQPTKLRKLSDQIPEPVKRIVLHCLELDPLERYGDMREVVSDLQNALAQRPISIGRRGSGHLLKLWYRRNRKQVWMVGGASTATVALAFGTWVQSLRSDRVEFMSELSAVQAEVGESALPGEFWELGRSLDNLRGRSQSFEGNWARRTFAGATELELTRVTEQWSQGLAEAFHAEARDNPFTHSPAPWSRAFGIDAVLCPDKEWNRELHARGHLILTGELADEKNLQLFMPGPRSSDNYDVGWTVYRRVPLPEILSVGYYRLVLPGEWVQDFLVEQDFGKPVFLKAQVQNIANEKLFEHPDLPGRRFSHIITNRDFIEYLDATGQELPPGLSGDKDLDEPHARDWRDAHAYASWAGGRLPDDEEVIVLLADQGEKLLIEGVGAEFLATTYAVVSLQQCSLIEYGDIAANLPLDQKPPMASASNADRDVVRTVQIEGNHYPTGYRVVFQP